MATEPSEADRSPAHEGGEVDLSGIRDRQRPIALAVGMVFIVVGLAGLTGALDGNVLGPGLVLGLFGIPFWLGVTAIVAGLLGVLLSLYEGAGTTFNKLAAGLVLPIVILLSVIDWLLAGGLGLLTGVLALILLVVAVALVAFGTFLLFGNPFALVLPVVAVVTLADWALGITPMVPAESVNPPTVGLLVVLALVIGLIGFEGGSRVT